MLKFKNLLEIYVFSLGYCGELRREESLFNDFVVVPLGIYLKLLAIFNCPFLGVIIDIVILKFELSY